MPTFRCFLVLTPGLHLLHQPESVFSPPLPPFPPAFPQVLLTALSLLHAQGVLHRDIKPNNVREDGGGLARMGGGQAHILGIEKHVSKYWGSHILTFYRLLIVLMLLSAKGCATLYIGSCVAI